MGFPGSSAGKESTCNSGDPGSIFGSGRFPGEGIGYPLPYSWVPLVAQMVKNLPAVWETWIWSLGWEDPQETWVWSLDWRSLGGGHGNPLQYGCLETPHGQRSLVGCSPLRRKESDTTEWLSTCSIGNSPSSLTVWSIASLLSWYLSKTPISPHRLFHLGFVCKKQKAWEIVA